MGCIYLTLVSLANQDEKNLCPLISQSFVRQVIVTPPYYPKCAQIRRTQRHSTAERAIIWGKKDTSPDVSHADKIYETRTCYGLTRIRPPSFS